MNSVEETKSVSRRKNNGEKMNLGDFYTICESNKKKSTVESKTESKSDVKTLSKSNKSSETEVESKTDKTEEVVSAKTLHNRRKKAKMRERKRTHFDSWTKVQKKEVKLVNLRLPDEYDSSGPSSSTNSDPNHTCVILKNLPNDAKRKDLKRFFKSCGTITQINIIVKNGRKGIAFITFQSKTGSDKALSLSGFWYENQKVYVDYSKPQGAKRFTPQNVELEN